MMQEIRITTNMTIRRPQYIFTHCPSLSKLECEEDELEVDVSISGDLILDEAGQRTIVNLNAMVINEVSCPVRHITLTAMEQDRAIQNLLDEQADIEIPF